MEHRIFICVKNFTLAYLLISSERMLSVKLAWTASVRNPAFLPEYQVYVRFISDCFHPFRNFMISVVPGAEDCHKTEMEVLKLILGDVERAKREVISVCVAQYKTQIIQCSLAFEAFPFSDLEENP